MDAIPAQALQPLTSAEEATTVTTDIFLRISVQDTGQGIPMEDARRLMEPFFQGSSNTTDDSKNSFAGTGLGLCELLAFLIP